MQFLNFSLEAPLAYASCGEFTAELGWQHHRYQHETDTEILVGLSGQVFLQVSGETFTLEAGDVLTVFPHETIQGTRQTVTPSTFFWLHVVAPATVTAQPAANALTLPRFFHLQAQEKAVVNIHQLLDVSHSHYLVPRAADYQATMLFIELANDAAQQRAASPSHQGISNLVREWIRTHMAEPLTVTAIADRFHLNASYLTRIFKRATGMSIQEYISSVRLDYARYLLLTTSEPVAAVARQAFFNDPKYFSRLFKKKLQLTPSQYRQAYTHTFLNNQQVDPGVDVAAQVAQLENKQR
ncbi:AraC family transcriptional regulator [Schleiferilactobacillus shenzhenensis]|nr:AraC family transcriptional regulator [Schleiferilactobacillus shenzhenensis]